MIEYRRNGCLHGEGFSMLMFLLLFVTVILGKIPHGLLEIDHEPGQLGKQGPDILSTTSAFFTPSHNPVGSVLCVLHDFDPLVSGIQNMMVLIVVKQKIPPGCGKVRVTLAGM